MHSAAHRRTHLEDVAARGGEQLLALPFLSASPRLSEFGSPLSLHRSAFASPASLQDGALREKKRDRLAENRASCGEVKSVVSSRARSTSASSAPPSTPYVVCRKEGDEEVVSLSTILIRGSTSPSATRVAEGRKESEENALLHPLHRHLPPLLPLPLRPSQQHRHVPLMPKLLLPFLDHRSLQSLPIVPHLDPDVP